MDTSDQPIVPYEADTSVLCQHTDNLYYEARITKVTKDPAGRYIYRLHYMGWNSRYDENLTHGAAVARFMAHTPENILLCKKQKDEALARKRRLNRGEKNGKRTSQGGVVSKKSRHESTVPSKGKRQSTKDKVPPIPEPILEMLSREKGPGKLSGKTTIDNFIKQYQAHVKGHKIFTTEYPNPDEVMKEVLECMVRDFNRQIKYCLNEEELKEYLIILNKKRSKLGKSALVLEDLNDPASDAEDENGEVPESNFNDEDVIPVSDMYLVIHFCRFIKKGLDTIKHDDFPFEDVYIPLFTDLLKFALKFVAEYD